MSSQPSIAAVAHFIESERILVALPLATKKGAQELELQLARCNAVLAIAAVLIGDEPPQRETITQP